MPVVVDDAVRGLDNLAPVLVDEAVEAAEADGRPSSENRPTQS
jgi:hypothetical protein